MKTADFHYDLPEALIAQSPPARRGESRLMVLEGPTGDIRHKKFPDILELINPGDLLVFNDSKVIPARLFGRKNTGGKVEILIERVLSPTRALAHARNAPKVGNSIILEDGARVTIMGRKGDLFEVLLETRQGEGEKGPSWISIMNRIGHVPLPPYIARDDALQDRDRYQTIYARAPGSAAAPTAGLHFTQEIIAALNNKGVETAFVTLHVGAGTFQTVRAEDIADHAMHSEYIDVSEEVCAKIKATRAKGGRVIAVGTTSLRCLETAQGKPFTGETDIFIYPGYEFAQVDALITNFHLSGSTLLMLVCAFAGYKNAMAAYSAAIGEEYRFFSYGDAMFIMRNPKPDTP